MFDMTDELISYLRAFQDEFGDIVPLRELPATVTTEEIIEAIKESLEKKENTLAKKFDFDSLDNDPNILV